MAKESRESKGKGIETNSESLGQQSSNSLSFELYFFYWILWNLNQFFHLLQRDPTGPQLSPSQLTDRITNSSGAEWGPIVQPNVSGIAIITSPMRTVTSPVANSTVLSHSSRNLRHVDMPSPDSKHTDASSSKYEYVKDENLVEPPSLALKSSLSALGLSLLASKLSSSPDLEALLFNRFVRLLNQVAMPKSMRCSIVNILRILQIVVEHKISNPELSKVLNCVLVMLPNIIQNFGYKEGHVFLQIHEAKISAEIIRDNKFIEKLEMVAPYKISETLSRAMSTMYSPRKMDMLRENYPMVKAQDIQRANQEVVATLTKAIIGEISNRMSFFFLVGAHISPTFIDLDFYSMRSPTMRPKSPPVD